MCGIAGLISRNLDLRKERECLYKMSRSLKRRGPDAFGEWVAPDAALLHRRLAVIDPARGAQPMRFGDLILVYNGELYNTDELRSTLQAKGYSFDTTCDTEVVLKAYHCWGTSCAEQFNGIFAFAVYHQNSKELFLCRDRIGVKPLYYSFANGIFAFASRMETLLYVPGIEPICSREGLNEIFMLGPAKTIGKTVFKDIAELPPASWLQFQNGKITVQSYWRLQAQPFEENEMQALTHTHTLVTDAIRRQLVSDVPLCTFLSGGLDSSIISEVAAQRYAEQGQILHTYSVDYQDNDRYFQSSLFQPNKDSDYIQMMAEAIGSVHHNVTLNNAAVAEALIDAAIARNTPGFTDVDSSLLLFCKEVKKQYTVCLSGECADEIFGGYPWYHRQEILFEETFPWSRSTDVRRRILKKGFLPEGEEYAHSAYLNTVNKTDTLPDDSRLERRMREMFVLNMDWFMQTLLVRKDVMSMEASLEVRVPFCDYRIVEYAYNMPWHIKALDGREKGILRKAFSDELPEVITWRKKSPYPKTFHPAYFEAVCQMADFVLSDKQSPLAEMLNIDAVRELMAHPNSLKEPWYGQLMRAPQVLAYLVQIYVWMRKYHVQIVY